MDVPTPAHPRRAPRSRHPGLHALLEKLHHRTPLTEVELARLRDLLEDLQDDTHGTRKPAASSAGAAAAPIAVGTGQLAPWRDGSEPLAGAATDQGARRLAARSGAAHNAFHRPAQDLALSSVGIGTYRGACDDPTDARYARSLRAALTGGINVIDSAINYREQRSERTVGNALRRFVAEDGGSRDEVVVCTKGGFLVTGALTRGTLQTYDVAQGIHALAPAFLRDQVRRSRANLGVETIDVYYLHNPEVQLAAVSTAEFGRRLRAAFAMLESEVDAGRIRYYGAATWHGLREGTLSIEKLAVAAREVGGDTHHFRFLQLPFNLGMQETASPADGAPAVLDVAADLGITVVASASLLQSRLSRHLPLELSSLISGLTTDAQRAVQFTRSTRGISTALVGMRDVAHVHDLLRLASVPPLSPGDYERLLAVVFG